MTKELKKEIYEYDKKVNGSLQLPPEQVGEGIKGFVETLKKVQEGRGEFVCEQLKQ